MSRHAANNDTRPDRGSQNPAVAVTPNGVRVSVPLRVAPSRPRTVRNGFSIMAYTGANGGGKTMAAVYDSLPGLAAGRPIVSTCRILDPVTGEPHPMWVPLDDPRLLLQVGYCEVIMDEVTGIASSRESSSMPSAVLNHLQQLRKDDATLRWTTPNWKRADTALREPTQGITTCVGLVKSTQVVTSEDGLERRWAQRKAFVWRTYDAKNFDEWSTAKERSPSKQHRIRPVARQLVWGPGLLARECYDTYEHAISWAHVTEFGMCMTCGGKRAQPRCICGDERAALLPVVDDNGCCTACAKKRRASNQCDCTPVEPDESPGMIRWRVVDASRKRPPLQVEIPETDDTPGVVVELPDSARETA